MNVSPARSGAGVLVNDVIYTVPIQRIGKKQRNIDADQRYIHIRRRISNCPVGSYAIRDYAFLFQRNNITQYVNSDGHGIL